MFKDALCKGKGAVFVNNRALFREPEPAPLGGLRNIGYTGLVQNTSHCEWCRQTIEIYSLIQFVIGGLQ